MFNHTPDGENPFNHYARQLQTELELEDNLAETNQIINSTARSVAFDKARSIQAYSEETKLRAHISYLQSLDNCDGGQRAKYFRELKAKCEQAEHGVWK